MKRAIVAALLFSLFLGSSAMAADASRKATLDKAQALLDQKKNAEAVALMDSYLMQHPKDAEALVLRGDAKENLAQYEDALIDFNAALAINPDYAYAHYSKCDADLDLGRYDDALAECSKSIELDKTDESAFADRAVAYTRLQRFDEAIKDAKTAIKMDPSDAFAYGASCRVERMSGKVDAARADCLRAIGLNPESEVPVWNLALIDFNEKNFTAAASGFEKALTLDDTDDGSHYWLALAYNELKSYDKALSHANAYILKEENDGDGYMARASIEIATQKATAAKADATEALHRYRVGNDQDGIDRAIALLNTLDKQ